MKVIDLLNKIVNGEIEDETILKVDGDFFYYLIVNDENLYVINTMTNQLEKLDSKYIGRFIKYQYDLAELKYISNKSNEEVEIIEEDNKIRKLDFVEEYTFSKRQNEMTNEDRRLLDSNFRELGIKINEIIDKLNEGE